MEDWYAASSVDCYQLRFALGQVHSTSTGRADSVGSTCKHVFRIADLVECTGLCGASSIRWSTLSALRSLLVVCSTSAQIRSDAELPWWSLRKTVKYQFGPLLSAKIKLSDGHTCHFRGCYMNLVLQRSDRWMFGLVEKSLWMQYK